MKDQFEYVLRDFLGHTPTNDQDKAINAMARFVYAPNTKVGFILKGYAGTGKTSLIGALVKTLNKFNLKSALLAPTGRAAKVLSSHAQKEAMTIHRKIYYQQRKGGAFSFTRGKNLHKNTIFIVDEASMIATENLNSRSEFESKDILEDLLRYVYLADHCKVIFIGDTAQLPPVGSNYSPALDKAHLEQHYAIPFGVIELKEVVRQATESGILENATSLRKLINHSYHNEIKVRLQTNQIDIFHITGESLQDELDNAINQYGIENMLVICRSNKRSNLFNQQIRHRILYHDEELNAGDLMMVVKNNYHWVKESSPMGFIANGDIIEILKINSTEFLYGFKFATITARFIDFPNEPEFECKVILESIMTESASLGYEKMQTLFSAIEEDFSEIGSKRKRMSLILKTPHYNALQVKFAYSVTCHKAQGGQWPVVFIDQGYLTGDMINVEYVRWLYTAITRATEKIYLVNFSPLLLQ